MPQVDIRHFLVFLVYFPAFSLLVTACLETGVCNFSGFGFEYSYQEHMLVIISADLVWSQYSRLCPLEIRYGPLKAGHTSPSISRWLVWTLACVKLNQGSQEVLLNYLLWFLRLSLPMLCALFTSLFLSISVPPVIPRLCLPELSAHQVFFWWDPCSVGPGLAVDEVSDCQPQSCWRRAVNEPGLRNVELFCSLR